ncbi:N-(5'-phosphoribosyl)anthranilate isomerase [Sulfuricella sp. T08]|uniref:phosphoribosylanthranilate isomerase n=1 Tax=Sulfuricella sp. T08 TaxID=1632857 RepID=UPI0006179665|nr:phosphoribosylanthranilate isomerase [Sulfuricella sp. T08]GAO36320.1 N-(5'-phosphoribosyl)anthranilate isomerase [Sulfuricella sp. T08]
MTRIKICGITRREDALACAHAGADAIGLVFYPPSPRHVEAAQAAMIARALPPFITTVGLFVNPTAKQVEAVLNEVHLDVLQFHGDEPPEFCARFGVPYLKAIRVKAGVDLVQCAIRYQEAQGLLLDAYVEGTPGGTGQSFDWELIPAGLPLPVILSGGLEPANVADAIRRVKPWAVDVSSGVEASKGIKDVAKIAAFIKGVRSADV